GGQKASPAGDPAAARSDRQRGGPRGRRAGRPRCGEIGGEQGRRGRAVGGSQTGDRTRRTRESLDTLGPDRVKYLLSDKRYRLTIGDWRLGIKDFQKCLWIVEFLIRNPQSAIRNRHTVFPGSGRSAAW